MGRKAKKVVEEYEYEEEVIEDGVEEAPVPKRRGRKPKQEKIDPVPKKRGRKPKVVSEPDDDDEEYQEEEEYEEEYEQETEKKTTKSKKKKSEIDEDDLIIPEFAQKSDVYVYVIMCKIPMFKSYMDNMKEALIRIPIKFTRPDADFVPTEEKPYSGGLVVNASDTAQSAVIKQRIYNTAFKGSW